MLRQHASTKTLMMNEWQKNIYANWHSPNLQPMWNPNKLKLLPMKLHSAITQCSNRSININIQSAKNKKILIYRPVYSNQVQVNGIISKNCQFIRTLSDPFNSSSILFVITEWRQVESTFYLPFSPNLLDYTLKACLSDRYLRVFFHCLKHIVESSNFILSDRIQ